MNDAAAIAAQTDSYFNRTKTIVARFGDRPVTYAVFLRRPVISAPRLMLDWLDDVAAARDTRFEVDLRYPEGSWIGAGEPIVYIGGSLLHLVDLETILAAKARARLRSPRTTRSRCALPCRRRRSWRWRRGTARVRPWRR